MDREAEHGERRRIPRQKSFLRGQILFNNRRNAVDCLIRDISSHGARLIFSAPITTPDMFDIHIPQKEQTLPAHVVWRSSSEVGVEFRQGAQVEPLANGGDLGERLQRLEVEVASLRRMIRKLKADADPDADVA